MKNIGLQRDLIFHKEVPQLASAVGRNKSLVDRAHGLIRGVAISDAPGQIVNGTQDHMMTQIEIHGIAELAGFWTRSRIPVEIDLDC